MENQRVAANELLQEELLERNIAETLVNIKDGIVRLKDLFLSLAGQGLLATILLLTAALKALSK